MKRVRCPKCDTPISFDETKYRDQSTLIFQCPNCGKQFGVRIKNTLPNTKTAENDNKETNKEVSKDAEDYGAIVVIENNYCYKQVLPLHLGDNTIGRYMKGNNINTPIETGDLTMDLLHCIINVNKDKKGRLKHVLRDGPSNHGTFVNGAKISPKERINLDNGNIFNIGVTSIIFKASNEE